jgi:large subunit ribosomal protein L21
MASSHGVQLQLALEEGRGKDDAPFDPFSQFLDGMGSAAEGFEDDDDIEEAEYKDLRSEDDDDDDDDGDDDDDREEGEGGAGPIYTTTGALYRPKSERLALRAGYPAGGKFAVIRLAGFQHKVTVDDLLVVNKLKPVSAWSVGSTHTVRDQDILLVADQNMTLVGLPGVNGGEVDVMVEEITRDKTLVVFKKRRRKNSRRKNGFRRQVTFLRVLDVRMPIEGTKKCEDMDIVDEDVRVAA